jgi:nucleoside-diphosphate-sugar epimerase
LILVTGATGFLGSHLVCQLLEKGHFVRACKRSSSDMKEFQFIFNHYFDSESVQTEKKKLIEWVIADLNDTTALSDAFKQIKVVYHCAALVSFESKDSDLLHKINVEGTANVVNAAINEGVEVLCYASSVAALGRVKPGAIIDENAKWENSKYNSNYAISKYKAELEVWRGAEEGLKVCMVNPGVILGVGNYLKGSNALIHTIFKGMPLYSTGVNGYVNVKDVCKVMLSLVEQKIYKQRFVMVSESLVIREVFFMIADAFGVKRPSIRVSPWMAEIAWRLMAVLRIFYSRALPITKETARAANHISFYDASKVRNTLGFEFTSIHDTIKECTNTYQDYIQFKI